MKNRFQFFFGLDCFIIRLPLTYFLKQCKIYQLDVYQCESGKEGIVFYAPIYQRKKYLSVFKDIEYKKTVGCLGFLLRQLNNPFRIFLLLWCIGLYSVLNHTVLKIEYQSTSAELVSKINAYLSENGYSVPFISYKDDLELMIKGMLKEQFRTEIAWLEVTQSGSKILISFNDKRYAQTKALSYDALIARKEAMIVRFDVIAGEKLVKLNQIVKEGDVLVDNTLIDAYGVPHTISVEGEVWGKTWSTVIKTMDVSESVKVLEPFHFLRLLYDARREIEKELDEDEAIIKENILQFNHEGSTITLIVHYTCLEEITRP